MKQSSNVTRLSERGASPGSGPGPELKLVTVPRASVVAVCARRDGDVSFTGTSKGPYL